MNKFYHSKMIALGVFLAGALSSNAQTTTFNYTGAVQSYAVPSGITSLVLDAQGAEGGSGWTGVYGIGGAGGRVQCTMAVTSGAVLYIYVGGQGDSATGAYAVLPGGWNGGGSSGGTDYPGSGGGASDIRTGGTALANRVLVAGGGGGAGYNCTGGQNGGAGGGLAGASGLYCSSSSTLCNCPTGGTQTAGGLNGTCLGGSASLGAGAAGSSYAGGGGGGFYGGGGGYNYASGAGGSSFTDPSRITGVTHTQGYNTSGNGVVKLTPVVSPIGGVATVCIGSTTLLTDAIAGGTWSSSASAVATVGLSTGIVTGVSAGTTIISYTIAGGYSAAKTVTVFPAPNAYTVTGGGTYCAGGPGSTIGISGSDVGVNYQLYIGGIPAGSAVAGTGTVISFGTFSTSGTYSVIATNAATGCSTTMTSTVTVTINPLPTAYAVIGGGSYCAGSAGVHVGLSGSNTGINYRLYLGSTLLGTLTGSGSSIDFGLQTAAGTYTVAGTDPVTGCAAGMSGSATIIVNPLPASITGSLSVCVGSTTTLANATSGGTWSSGSSNATIGATSGIATGVSGGTSIISYTLATGCDATTTLTVDALPTITVSSSSACGNTYTLTAGGGLSYSWAPSTGLSFLTGSVTTASPATTTTYTVMGTDANGCTNTSGVNINGNRIFGFITFSGLTPDTLDMKVWLIHFNPTDSSITALDSTTTCTVDSIGYYEFDGKPSGNYMVKAKLLYGNPPGLSGYVPTYSLNSPYWYAGATAAHTSGSDSLHIDMVYGTVPTGPGFIAGYVYSGAGKGTTGDAAASGMLMYLENSGTHVLTAVYTDATGAYSFNNLAYGDYNIYPEDYNYHTTPSAVITLNSSNPTVSGINFKQYTTSKKIMPIDYTGVKILPTDNGISVYPNPSTGLLNVQWKNQQAGSGVVVITDMMGREVFQSALDMNAASGQSQFNLGGLSDGIYLIAIKCGNINYSAKLTIQQ